jgi:putative transposase
MPVHRSKKCTTTNSNDSTEGQFGPGLPSQQVFQQHLRELARAAMRIVLERVMREELDALTGVGRGESSPKRNGYRNGYSQRDLVTSSGRLADLNVAETLMGVAPSASAISRLNGNLEQQFQAWRERSRHSHWRILYLDGVHFSVRHGDQADSTVILTSMMGGFRQ